MKALRLISSVLCGCMIFGEQVLAATSGGPKTRETLQGPGNSNKEDADFKYNFLKLLQDSNSIPLPSQGLSDILRDLYVFANGWTSNMEQMKKFVDFEEKHQKSILSLFFKMSRNSYHNSSDHIKNCRTEAEKRHLTYKAIADALKKVYENKEQNPTENVLQENGIVPSLFELAISYEQLIIILTREVADKKFWELLVGMCQKLSDMCQRLSDMCQRLSDEFGGDLNKSDQ